MSATTNVLPSTFALRLDPPATGGIEDGVVTHPADITAHGWDASDYVTVTGLGRTVGRLAAQDAIERGSIALGPMLRAGVGARADHAVSVEVASSVVAERIVFAIVERGLSMAGRHNGSSLTRLFCAAENGASTIPSPDIRALDNRPLTVGSLLDHMGVRLRAIETVPAGVAVVTAGTAISVVDPQERRTSYRDVGGLSAEVAHIREVVELPMRGPEIFAQLGIDAPRGLLLYGPPGCGKTLIARAIAQQTDASFVTINGPEVIQKHYGESEELLRKVFDEAQKHPAAILFIDEIDALAPNRETVLGDVEKRVVGQLLALMDGASSRGKVVVMAATNLPNNVDPALRRPGRFDREIAINPPTKAGRVEILAIHTRFMLLAADVDLERIAAITHGFLGADLAALFREAGMACARDSETEAGGSALFVRMAHFKEAFAGFRLSIMRELVTDIAETRWDDIGGLDEAKRLLKEAFNWPLVYSPRFKHAGAQAPKGILLTGASGTGKTLLAQAVGSTTEVNFIVARGPELLSKWVGESERGIREVFRRARQSAPSIIFFDEIDAITPTRGKSTGDGQIGDRMVGQFLLELDRIDGDSGVVVLAATNRPDLVDRALLRPGRFDLVIDLPEPDRATHVTILKVHCRQSPLGNDVDFATLASATDGLNGADLAALCQQAKTFAIRESVEAEAGPDFVPFTIDARHFEAALRVVGPQHRATRGLDHAA
jgi:transitional endoplasmic reticulum ATPase